MHAILTTRVVWFFRGNSKGDHFGIFSREVPLKNQDPDPNTGVSLSCLLKIPGNIGGSLGIPWGDGALTDLEADRASSDSLEVKACRPIKTLVLHSFILFWGILMQFWIILDHFGIFSGEVPLKNQDPDPNTGVCWAAFSKYLGILGVPWGFPGEMVL